jgi:hypothetical protein
VFSWHQLCSAALIAGGLNPDVVIFYKQSQLWLSAGTNHAVQHRPQVV